MRSPENEAKTKESSLQDEEVEDLENEENAGSYGRECGNEWVKNLEIVSIVLFLSFYLYFLEPFKLVFQNILFEANFYHKIHHCIFQSHLSTLGSQKNTLRNTLKILKP